MMRRLHERGTRVVTGLDAGLNPWLSHGNLPNAVTFFAEAGFTLTAALASATAQAAQVCGVGDRKGRLRPGYDADLLIVEGDLAADLGALRQVRSVLLGGDLVS
jgi:imidazolonepropionase-like amidohydrolase